MKKVKIVNARTGLYDIIYKIIGTILIIIGIVLLYRYIIAFFTIFVGIVLVLIGLFLIGLKKDIFRFKF